MSRVNTLLYERNINSRVMKADRDRLVTEASLLDLNHSIRVLLTTNTKTRIIEKASAVFLKAPLKICDSTLNLMKKIEGLRLERGINGKLVDILGRSDGCTHLYELTLNAVRLTFNVMIGLDFNWRQWLDKPNSDEEFIMAAMPYLENFCLPFKNPKKK